MVAIDEIMDMIDQSNRIDIQEKGINLAKSVKCMNVFIRPSDELHNKNVWGNCAKILSARLDEELTPYLIALLGWLKELEWPGALCILNRVNRYRDDRWFTYAIRESIKEAKAMSDQRWINNLSKIQRQALQGGSMNPAEPSTGGKMVERVPCNIDEIMDMIDWNKSIEEQARGIELARSLKTMNAFLQPGYPGHSKNVWDNCAQILSDQSDEELQPYLIPLLEWLQDANWPGFFVIKQRLKRMPAEMLVSPYLICVKRAVATVDRQWITYLSDFIDLEEFCQLIPVRIQRFMKRHYGEWTF